MKNLFSIIKENRYGLISGVLVGMICFMTVATRIPSVFSPYSLTVVIPNSLSVAVLGKSLLSSIPIPIISYGIYLLIYNKVLFTWERFKYFLMISLLTVISSILYFIRAFNYGIKYQGVSHTYFVSSIWSLLVISIIIFAYLGIKRKNQFTMKLYGTIFFIWLYWCSFPWFGELI